MYKNFYNFNLKHLLKIRLHLGHQNSQLNINLTAYLLGTRHNINVYNLDKLWQPYRYLYYTLIQNFYKRSSFFIVGTNKHLPMTNFLENLLEEYPFTIEHNSFYVSGYVDRKWIGGLFSNWKIFKEFIQYLHNPNQKFKKRYRFQRYFFFIKGIRHLYTKPIPDFFLFLEKNDEAFFELSQYKVPLIGLVDTNMDPTSFLYPFFSNNDSVENLEFFFFFLKDCIQEGRLQEQQQYYTQLILKLKKIIIGKLKKKKKKIFLKNIKKKPVVERIYRGGQNFNKNLTQKNNYSKKKKFFETKPVINHTSLKNKQKK